MIRGLRLFRKKIDMTTSQERFMLSVFVALSELEREQTLQRQTVNIKAESQFLLMKINLLNCTINGKIKKSPLWNFKKE